jgi:hypothetical protein
VRFWRGGGVLAWPRTLVHLCGETWRRIAAGSAAASTSPFTAVEGLFTVLMCPVCLAARARGRGPYPDLTDEEMRAGLDQLPTWALEQKAAANRQVIAVMRGRLELGEPVQRMYGPLGLAWLQRQAEIAEQLIRARGQRPPVG